MLEKSTVRREAKPRQVVWIGVVMRDMLHPLGEKEGREFPKQEVGCGMQELSPWLAAVVQQPKTKSAEENASACFLKHACPKGSQMFLECPFSSSL